MFGQHVPSGQPGSLAWISQRVGVPTYNLAQVAAGQPGHMGNQGRFYLALANHRRMRQLAEAAAAQHQPIA